MNKENIIKEKLIDAIKQFIKYISITEDLFRNEIGKSIPPLVAAKSKKIIPLKGFLEFEGRKIEYQFHGYGCCLYFDEKTKIDFNYEPPDWNFEGISLFKFWEFVKFRIPEYEDKNLLKRDLINLEKEKIIKRKNMDSFIFNIDSSTELPVDDSEE